MVRNGLPNDQTCYFTIQNERYLVCVSRRVTVYRKEDLSFIHCFAGFYHPQNIWFWDEDTIAVITAKNEVHLLSIEKKKRLWYKKGISGGHYEIGKFAPNRADGKIFGVFARSNLTAGAISTLSPFEDEISIVKLPKAVQPMRAVFNVIADYPDGSVTFQHGASFEDGRFYQRIWRGYPPFSEPFDCVWGGVFDFNASEYVEFQHHNETYVFGLLNNYCNLRPRIAICTNWHTGERLEFPLPSYFDQPMIQVDLVQNSKYLIVNDNKVLLVIDFATGEHIAQYTAEYLSCCEIIGEKIIIGTWQKTLVYPFPYWMEWKEKPKPPEQMPDWWRI